MFARKLRELAYPVYQRAPDPIRVFARKAYDQIKKVDPEYRWIKNVYTSHGMEQRRRIMMDVVRFQHINRPIAGYYMEFGSHEANTMRLAWDCTRHLFQHRYVAFDSFEGLPDITPVDRQDIWEKGKLATAEDSFVRTCVQHGMPRDRLTTVKGFYDRSLTPALAETLLPTRAAIVYVDCDLYASTVPVLRFITPFLQSGTVIVFDDWNCFYADPEKGERRAWSEYLKANPTLRFEPLAETGMQKAFVFLGRSGESTDPNLG